VPRQYRRDASLDGWFFLMSVVRTWLNLAPLMAHMSTVFGAVRFCDAAECAEKGSNCQKKQGVTDKMTGSDSEHGHARFGAEESDAFRRRLELVLGDESIRSFAGRSGLPASNLRRLLDGQEPSLSALIGIARAGDVCLEWLATGEGPMRPGAQRAHDEAEEDRGPVDIKMLEEILLGIGDIEVQEGRLMEPEMRAKLAAALYDYFVEEDGKIEPKEDMGKVIKLIRKVS
jgi:hypothetical protein